MSVRKFWTINGSAQEKEDFAERKEDLKPRRQELNRRAGVDEKIVKSNEWPFQIIKGPDHPSIKPYFREIPVNAVFWVPRGKGIAQFTKINSTEGVEYDHKLPTKFMPDDQFIAQAT